MRHEAGWRRFFALVIDIIILAIVGWIIGLITGNAHGGTLKLGTGASLLVAVIDFA